MHGLWLYMHTCVCVLWALVIVKVMLRLSNKCSLLAKSRAKHSISTFKKESEIVKTWTLRYKGFSFESEKRPKAASWRQKLVKMKYWINNNSGWAIWRIPKKKKTYDIVNMYKFHVLLCEFCGLVAHGGVQYIGNQRVTSGDVSLIG